MGEVEGSDAAPWAPPALRSLFVGARLGKLCDGQHPPRVVHVGGDMWIAACGADQAACEGKGASLLFRVGRWSRERSKLLEAAPVHFNKAILRSIGAAKPLAIDPGCLVPASVLKVARALGTDRWGAMVALDVPGIVGFEGAFEVSKARAVIALLKTSAEQYGAEFERVAGRA